MNIKFWHKVLLNDGSFTDGLVDLSKHTSEYLFDDLEFKNKSVADIGCWDGYFSFEAEKRGASRVVSVDDPSCRWGGLDGYNFLHDHFKSNAVFILENIYNLKRTFKFKEFDILLGYGLLYHLSDPLLALNNLFFICKDIIVFEGKFSMTELPSLELIPYMTLNSDWSNIYTPSISYMNLIANYNGFIQIKTSQHTRDRHSIMYKRNTDKIIEFAPNVFPNVINK